MSTEFIGPGGEKVIAHDDVGNGFLQSYRRASADGFENSARAMTMMASVIDAAGGEVRVPYGGLDFGGIELTATIDEATRDLVLTTKRS